MILAAGRGERMRPLTDNCPKPLLTVNGMPLIEYHINNLVASGIRDIVINHAWLGDKIVQHLGSGKQFSANINYSKEPVALETAGGIIKALPLLTDDENETFLVVNGDIYCDYNFQTLPRLAEQCDAHVLLVENPDHNIEGDFAINQGLLSNPTKADSKTYTFSGVAIYRRGFFTANTNQCAVSVEQNNIRPLAPMLRAAADKNKVSANVITEAWTDVGTPERLAKLNII